MAIYQRRIDEKELEAEDHVLWASSPTTGPCPTRRRRMEKSLEPAKSRPSGSTSSVDFYVQARRWDDAIAATDRLSEQPGWEAHGSDDARHDSLRSQ